MNKTIDQIIDEHSKPKCQGSEGPCDQLGTRRRTNTSYITEEDNWVIMCDECFEIEQAYWAERWTDFYQGCL